MPIGKTEKICPICGQDNNCKHDQEGKCWCETLEVSKKLLDMVPKDKKDKSCICKSCIENFNE